MPRPSVLLLSTQVCHGRVSRHHIGTAGTEQKRVLSLIRTIDSIIPRTRFGSSIYTTPVLLLLRLFYGAAPFEDTRPQASTEEGRELKPLEEDTRTQVSLSKLSSYQKYPTPQHRSHSLNTSDLNVRRTKLNQPSSPVKPRTISPLLSHPQKSTVQSFHSKLQSNKSQYATYRLISLTWIKALESHLSHEYIQFIIEDSVTLKRHRLLIDRQECDDFVHSGPHLRDLNKKKTMTTTTKKKKKKGKLGLDSDSDSDCKCEKGEGEAEEGLKRQKAPSETEVGQDQEQDQYHSLPLPLLSLEFTHQNPNLNPNSNSTQSQLQPYPSLNTIISLAHELSTKNPNYNLYRHTCWWYAESIFEGMLALASSVSSSSSPCDTTTTNTTATTATATANTISSSIKIKQYPSSHLRYSFVLRIPSSSSTSTSTWNWNWSKMIGLGLNLERKILMERAEEFRRGCCGFEYDYGYEGEDKDRDKDGMRKRWNGKREGGMDY